MDLVQEQNWDELDFDAAAAVPWTRQVQQNQMFLSGARTGHNQSMSLESILWRRQTVGNTLVRSATLSSQLSAIAW